MKIKIIIIIMTVFYLTGCTSYTELNKLSIVNTLGIDYQNGKYHLIVNVVEGKYDDGEIEKNLITYSSTGETLEKAFHYIYTKSNKRLYLSHIDLLVLTENAIDKKFNEIINNFLENNEYRNNFNTIILKDIELEDFLNKKIPAEDINSLLETNHKEVGITKPVDFESIMKDLLIDSNTYLPTITYQDNSIVTDGYTLIKNYKVYDNLSKEESILFNLLNNQINKSYLNECSIFENQTLIKTENNHITFSFITNLLKDNHYQIETKKDLLAFLKKYQAKNYDILKLVEIIRKNDYKYYQKTDNLLQKLTFEFEFKITEKENYIKGDEF